MKSTFKFFLLSFLIFQSLHIYAQTADTTQTTIRFLKRDSRRFIVKINTDEGIKKGLLYAADSNGIVILDSVYEKSFYHISKIKSLEVRRKNNFGHGFASTFLFVEGAGVGAGALLLIGGFFAGEAAYTLPYALYIAIYFAPFAIGTAVAIGLASVIIPTVQIAKFTPEKYLKKLRFINRSTQAYLLKKHPKSKRLVVTY